ncbi:MAG: VOC family protein [Gemmobacter sp.]|nr:VOC family protein [Gemmobacter sp.]
MKIEKMERVAVAVRDMDKAAPFFEELLGVRFDPVIESPELGMSGRYSAEGLELVAGTEGSVIDKFIDGRGQGVFCVVFKVTDMDAAISHFAGKGLKPVNDVTFGAMREVAFHPRDSFGLQIVLAEYNAVHPATYAALGK